MKIFSTLVVGMVVLASILVAQENPKNNASGAQKAAQSPTAGKTKAATASSARALTEKEKRGYALGVDIGSDVARQQPDIDPRLLMQGMADGLSGGKLLMTVEELNVILSQMQREQSEKMAFARKEFAEKNKKEGEAFLAANKGKEGVVVLPSGLQYKILKQGNGQKPGLDDQVLCNYRGTLIDGTEIDSSYSRNQPSVLPLKGVLKGWTEALQLMPVGSKWQLFLPSELAYGERGNGRNIGPNATLIFEVELLSIQNGGAEARSRGNL
jgi:FKBP-type peptidyl-prolyl cis-trans isomerase FklB